MSGRVSKPTFCSVEKCSDSSDQWARKENAWFCRFHYRRVRKGRAIDLPRRDRNSGECIVANCDRKATSRLMCATHYARSIRGSDLTQAIKVWSYKGLRCKIDGCDRVAKSDFMCAAHADRERNGLEVTGRPFKRAYKGEACQRSDCNEKASCLDLCRRHYGIARKYGFAALNLVDDYIKDGCPICGRSASEAGQPRVDHDHSCCPNQQTCGKCVRGAICNQCNWGLGQFQDSADVLKRAMRYLQGNHPAALQRREA